MIVRGPASALPFPAFRQRFPWIGADLQTLRNTLRGTGVDLSAYAAQRLRFACLDGSGDVLQGVLNLPSFEANKALVIVIHGLTGSEDSSHVIASAHYFLSLGHPVLRLNQRGAGPSQETCKGYYHAGRSEDVACVVSQLSEPLIRNGVCLLAVSLGGNVLLKFLAEYPRFAHVKAAVAVSPPVDLKSAQMRIMHSRNRYYHQFLLNRMKLGVQNIDFIKENSSINLDKITTVYDFDDQIVAPANGFSGAMDYYQNCSALELLDRIDTPTLIIHPADDPWVPVDPLLAKFSSVGTELPDQVSLLSPENGGHIGGHGKSSSVPWHNICARLFFDNS